MELLLVIYFLYARGPVPRGRINEELGETSQRKIKALLLEAHPASYTCCSFSRSPSFSSVAAALVGADRVYQEDQDFFLLAAKEPPLLCSCRFMGTVGRGPDLVCDFARATHSYCRRDFQLLHCQC